VDGKLCIAQRFAIDWMQLGPDGRLFHDNPKSNANFYGYGAEVLAVTDARVADLRDDVAENQGDNPRTGRHVTVDSAVGNYVTLDLGEGRFALYGHLQPHSVKVKLGDKINAGQVLALLGNSGNSDAPHLHFHLMDANSPLGAEGLPYELETFTQTGTVDGAEESLDAGQPWRPGAKDKAVVHNHEFPANTAVVTFP
jgi:murein DD-endopeptidase MepM/ murein hydrolase activator NlpD